jgi:glycosyltransferase involved in cell wall biosynthesis
VARVLLVGKGPPEHGGIPSFLADIQSGAAARDHDIALANLTRPGEPQGGRASLTNLRRTLADARQVWQSAAGRDVVHLHTAFSPGVTALRAGALALVARARGSAVLLHVHGGRLPLWATTPSRRLVVRLALLPVTHVLAVSAAVAETLQAAAPSRPVELLDNGVDVDRFTPAGAASRDADRTPRVLYVGLLSPRKGVLDLAAASAELRRRGLAHELHLVGGTPDEGPDAEAAVRAGLSGLPEVVLHGSVDHQQMPMVYREADVFCLPSWYEAMPLSVLEALATALPVVATDVGDVARAVLEGETGRLVQPRQPAALAEALALLLGDREKRSTMGLAGRELVRNRFFAGATQRRLAEIYDQLGRGRA